MIKSKYTYILVMLHFNNFAVTSLDVPKYLYRITRNKILYKEMKRIKVGKQIKKNWQPKSLLIMELRRFGACVFLFLLVQKGSASYDALARWLDLRLALVAQGRSEADKFNSGNSCWSCSRIHPTLPVSHGRVRTGNSSSQIRMKLHVDGESAKANLIWITTNSRAL